MSFERDYPHIAYAIEHHPWMKGYFKITDDGEWIEPTTKCRLILELSDETPMPLEEIFRIAGEVSETLDAL